jgi:hypothetical protein
MSSIEDYLKYQEYQMKREFERVRKMYSDSDVKGGANENIVAEFLRKYISCHFVATNSQIVDSYDSKSNEIDVCVCNKDQPRIAEDGAILISEGIDFVVQVKAILTKREIERAKDNCKSVKMLLRKRAKEDIVLAMDADIPYYVHRIPYFVFAFTVDTKFETLLENIYDIMIEGVDYFYQPDGVFILDKGYVVNCRAGKGVGLMTKESGKEVEGLFAFETKQSLSDFMKWVHIVVPRFYRVIDPLAYYMRDEIKLSNVRQL